MGQQEHEILFLLDAIGGMLQMIESRDTVISEKVNLNEYIPSLSGPAPALRSHQGKRALIDPEALRASIQAANKLKAAGGELPKVREKDYLLARRAKLQAEIQLQMNQNKELELQRDEFERRLMDLQTRQRLGSRSQIGSQDFEENASSDIALTAEDWKRKYDEMEKKYRFLTDALHKKGQITRVSAGKSRPIPPPHIPPVLTFDYGAVTAERGPIF
jgi:hypothetical protein